MKAKVNNNKKTIWLIKQKINGMNNNWFILLVSLVASVVGAVNNTLV